MAFGISFGKNSTKTNQTTSVDKQETGTQSGTQTTGSAGTSTSTGSTSSSGSSTGTNTSTQSGTSTTTGAGSQSQVQTSQLFNDPILGSLEGAVTSLLTQVLNPNQGREMMSAGLSQLGDFDAHSFVEQGLARAQAQQGSSLDEMIGGLFDAIGGGGDDNSQAMLLADRVRGAAAGNLAGIESELTGRAMDILRGNIGSGLAVQGQEQELLNNLIGQLRGGRTTATGETQTATSETGQTSQAGTTQTHEQSAQEQQSQQATTQALLQIMSQLLSTDMHTTGTETTVGTQKKSGGGFSLGI